MLERELRVVKQAVRKAGAAILRVAEQYGPRVAAPVDRTIVTRADIEADGILREYLRNGFPDYGWLSEETRGDPTRLQCARVWIVDPLDGTREFVMKVPEFVVSVALAQEGKIILGVVYHPCSGDLYEAAGEGTRLNGRSVACNHALGGKPQVEVSRSDLAQNYFAGYEACGELRPVGSIAFKLARLAAGQADATLSVTPKNEWDIAAGVCLVTQAGGKVTDLAGRRHRFNQSNTLCNGVVAASAGAYDSIRQVVTARQLAAQKG